MTLGATVENVLGSGTLSAFDGGEFRLSLASVLERGDKRTARRTVALLELDAVALERETRRLDLLAEVARRYLDAIAVRQTRVLARRDLEQRQRMVEATARRQRLGAADAAEHAGAEAAYRKGVAEIDALERAERQALLRLALMWGADEANFEPAGADLSVLPTVPDFGVEVGHLAEAPELRRFAHRRRLLEARAQLARSARVADLDWQVGVVRLQSARDWGFGAGIGILLGTAARAEPDLRRAEAELAAVEFERAGEERALRATLAEAWGQLDQAVALAQRLDQDVLPALEAAAAAAERAYRAGASGYLGWAQWQTDITLARKSRLEASLAAHRALIELQRLTGRSLIPAGDTDWESPR